MDDMQSQYRALHRTVKMKTEFEISHKIEKSLKNTEKTETIKDVACTDLKTVGSGRRHAAVDLIVPRRL